MSGSVYGQPVSDAEELRATIRRLEQRVAELEQAEVERDRSVDKLLRLANIVENSEDAIIGKTLDGIVETWNDGAQAVYGYAAGDMIGKSMTLLLPPDRADEEEAILERLRRGERVEHFETTRVRKDGRQIHVSLTISPLRDRSGRISGASHVARDISERKALEAQVLQAQKLESLGVLAGGVAHDFNNLLTGILGNASLAIDDVPPGNPGRKLLQDIMRASERAAALTRQLLAFAGKGRFVTEQVDLSALVLEISDLIQTSIPRKVQVRLATPSGLPTVLADSGQLQQVVMNLVLNAAEAIGDAVGTVFVSTAAQDVDEAYLRTIWGRDDLQPGRYIALEVQDDGCGMDEATVSRIFDPFFTTKFAGRGLGLAAVLGIVRGHRGALKVYSSPGKGTTFKVLFPTTDVRRTTFEVGPRRELRGSETVLVVDDEEIVRETARHALERYGYTVLLARDGQEALEVFRSAADRIAMVLLDLTMPVMGGEEVLRHMKAFRPDVPVLLSSGFNEVEAVRRFIGQGLAGFIQKPYAAAQLVHRIRDVLGAAEGAAKPDRT